MSDAFFGRATEIAALTGLLQRGERIVTIVGPPGVGKSRLARRVAERWSDRSGPLVFVDLSEASSAGSIASAVTAALGAAAAPAALGVDPLLAAAQSLAARGPVVLVLDDFERLVRWALVTVHRWRDLAPAAQFLVTSRERLHLPEEIVFELGPLAVPADDADLGADAAAFLTDRLRRLRGAAAREATDAPIAPGDAAALCGIARALEGLPLSLELASARLDVLDPPALLARLTDRFALLREGPTGDDRLERSLAGALECSWQLLSEAEQSALAQCTVFRGGFSLEAAEAVVELPRAGSDAETPPVIDVVQALRDRSLLRAVDAPPPGGRRLGLYATIRDFVSPRLAPEATSAVADRHLAFFARCADGWRGARTTRVVLEQENLLAAVAHGLRPGASHLATRQALSVACALDALPAPRLALEEHIDLLDRAVAASAVVDVEGPVLATVLTSRGRAFRRAGRNADGASDLERAAELARAAGDRALEGRVLHGLGRIRVLQDRLDDAETTLRRALELHRETNDLRYEATTLSTLGFVALQRDDAAGAADHAARALQCVRDLEDTPARAESECLYFLALVHHHRGELEAARAAYESARRAAESGGDTWIAAFCRIETGLVLLEEGRIAEARTALEQVEPMIAGFDTRGEGLLLSHLGAVRALSGDLVDAGWLFDRAERILQATDVALLPAVVGPQRGLLDLARATRARASGDEDGARRLERAAGERLATARAAGRLDGEVSRGASVVNTDLVVACRILEGALHDRGLLPSGEPLAGRDAAPASRGLVVEPEGRWFEPPSGARVSCERRRPLRRILLALARARIDTPGRALGRDELLAAGWPGERARPEAARNRLNVALHELRKLGLREVLRTSDGGCRLDESVPMRWGT